jgi:hypothetical protein
MTVASTRPRPFDLAHRIKSAEPGETIYVTAGEYPPLKLHKENPAETVVIQAQEGVILPNIDVSNCSNLTFQGPFEVAGVAGENEVVGIRQSTNITLDGLRIHGDFNTSKGVKFGKSTNVVVRNCEFYSLLCAVSVASATGYVADNNHVHDIRRDAFMGVGVRNGTLTNNIVHDMYPVGTAGTGGDHADSFQFWSDDANGGPCSDIVIANNVVFPGQGTGCQGPFINGSGHRNFTITDNWVLSGDAFANAISITGCDGVTIQNNWVLGHDSMHASIRVHDADGPCSNVVQTPNVAVDHYSNETSGDPLVPPIAATLFATFRRLTQGRTNAHSPASA